MVKLLILLFLGSQNFGFCTKLSKKVRTKQGVAVYRCTCADENWSQEASKVKACTYCGPAMPQCGVLQKVLPKKGEKYSIHDYVLPNIACPVDDKETHKSILSKYRGRQIQFCSRKCKRSFTKEPLKFLKNMIIKPEVVGLKFKKSGKASR
ncbi:MAG: hypothetical protein KC646_11820 [Candidatus Cloacimonetes bacterium]|nr:hypothetical protein [Candidatus Cloacimonadota bacterium]